MKNIIRKIKNYFLMLELKNNSFMFGGHNESMVNIIDKRFLSSEEVEQVKEWRKEGKIVEVGTWSVVGHCGRYTETTYRYKSNA
jgi:hypothetical protein